MRLTQRPAGRDVVRTIDDFEILEGRGCGRGRSREAQVDHLGEESWSRVCRVSASFPEHLLTLIQLKS